MTELAVHLPPEVGAELWCGGPPVRGVARPQRRLYAVNRDSRLFGNRDWHRRYLLEQLSALPVTLLRLGRGRFDVVYCGDPVLAWHIKRFRPWHRAKVVFMNGMRLSPNWARSFDGVHLLAPTYLDEARQMVSASEWPRFFVAPHFVDSDRFVTADADGRRAARSQFGIPPGAAVFLNVGPVGKVSGKRPEFLIEAVRGLGATSGREAVLVSAGVDEDGSADVRQLGRQLLGDRALFLGRVARDQMPALYQAADAFAIAALNEPFSIAILEAMASGIPVVYHPDAVHTWLVGEGGVGVDMTDGPRVTAAMKQLAGDAGMRHALGAAGRLLAGSRYSPGVVCAQLIEGLRRVCASPPSAT